MRIGYGRVSTRDQNPDAQEDALKAAQCDQIFVDKASGKLASRPELDKALIAAREGDEFVITKLDRLGRSLKNLIELSELLHERGVNLVVLDQAIDTSTPSGRMFFHILGAVAEFERALTAERTRDGLAAAPFAPPFRGSNNSTATTYPRTMRFRDHLADLPKEIPGGQKAPELYDKSKILKLEAEAQKLRELIEKKEDAKRQKLREWDGLEREAETAQLKVDLAESSLRGLNGEADVRDAF